MRADALQSSIEANCPDSEARQNVQTLIDALQKRVVPRGLRKGAEK